jgi:hypothetical protein
MLLFFAVTTTTAIAVAQDDDETAKKHLRRYPNISEQGPAFLLTSSSVKTMMNTHTHTSNNNDIEWQAPEPYPPLFGFEAHGNPPVPLSPDPLISYTWPSATTDASQLQSYRLTQNHHGFHQRVIFPKSAISILPSGAIQIQDSVTMQWDWGVERAAWFEILLQGITDTDGWKVEMALSEFNSVYPGKRRVPQRYPNNKTNRNASEGTTYTYRLETNDELYEGVRFTWLYITKTKSQSAANDNQLLLLIDASIVSKLKPISYMGRFASSCPKLTQIWYTGAYGVRLNMEATQFNSVLMERGDRVAIQGDGHPTMATALFAFGGQASSQQFSNSSDAVYDLVWNQLWKTNSGHVHGHHVVDDAIMAYPLYWIGSVLDWYWATGDNAKFAALVPDVLSILDLRIADFMDPNLDIGWMGWDDRLGNGWCYHSNHNNCTREGHLTFGALVAKVTQDVAHALDHLPHHQAQAQHYKQIHKDLIQRYRQLPDYPHGLGVHAAGNAILSEIASPSDIKLWMTSTLNDIVTICSWSAFNQYWILQGLGAAEQMEHAIASIQTCWGSMLDTGKGCFYELYSPEWSNFRRDGERLPTTPSMCHPWASGVTAWMSSALTGIKPVTPGYSRFVAAPYVSANYPSVNGTVPTPLGGISVVAIWKAADDGDNETAATVEITLSSPEHTKCYIGVRKCVSGCKLNFVQINGAVVEPYNCKRLGVLARDWAASMEHNILLVTTTRTNKKPFEGGETTRVTASYTCSKQSATTKCNADASGFPPAHYPASVSMDRATQGDGLLKHGSDGYVLLGINEDGSNEENLPSYISSVSIYQHGFTGSAPVNASYVGTSNSNKTYLPYKDSRSLGILGDNDDSRWYPYRNPGIVVDVSASTAAKSSPSPFVGRLVGQGLMIDVATKASSVNLGGRLASQGFSVDVKTNTSSSSFSKSIPTTTAYKLSVYSVAGTGHEQFAIRVMDLTTLNMIAPTLMMDKHQGGVWWTVEYDYKSLRLRIMSMYGMHISAVAFSSSESSNSDSAVVE